jgi:putative CocE/NonD family hydrolase
MALAGEGNGMKRSPLLAAALLAPFACAQTLEEVKAAYVKTEQMIPMRDGRRLFTSIYLPKDAKVDSPILLMRTPYSCAPYGADAYRAPFMGSKKFFDNRYIFVYQDVRGRYMSEGDFIDVRPQLINPLGPHDIDESTDTYDTIQYLIDHVPNNNGRVGVMGISYPGGYAALAALSGHPALKAASPQAPTADWFIGDDFHHNGALFLQDVVSFYSGFGNPRPAPTTNPGRIVQLDLGGDAYKFFLELGPLSNVNDKYFKGKAQFWNDALRHGTYDEFWQARSIPPRLKNLKPAMLWVGGWFDAEDLYGPLACYKSAEKLNTRSVSNRIIMGPWYHGGWARSPGRTFGDQNFESNTSTFYLEEVEFPFFDAHLRGNGRVNLAEATMFNTGANVWRKFDAWPPKSAKEAHLYFGPSKNIAVGEVQPSGSYAYVSDPANPVPYQQGTLVGRTREYMIDDQRFAEARKDVVTLRSAVLDKPLTFGGEVEADIYFKTSGTDLDFIVKIIDEFPADAGGKLGNYQMLVRGEVMRTKFRNSFSNPSPLTPGKVERVRFKLPDMLHTFKSGHRIIVQIQSSWFPLVDRNPHKFLDIYSAKAEDYVPANVEIMVGGTTPSGIHLSRID